jgi:alginate O-acetyltransferase complex protein AlgI
MVFSSLEFMFLFLPAMLLVYFAVPGRLKNLLLLLGSLFFYAWGEPVYIVLMIVSITINYFLAIDIDRHRGTSRSLIAVVTSVAISLLFLGFFKYADFAVGILNGVLGTDVAKPQLPLPIGISFYTFQVLSYTIDVYRGKVAAQRDFVTLAMYISLFPQLIAGPIVRYRTILPDLTNRTHSLEAFSAGARRFTVGLAKKVIIANNIGLLWKSAMETSEPSVALAWLGVIGFSFQIYFDFSGYSDMAIGLGRMFGFTFPENFNYPYISQTVTEFWRRWHISLGQWFRDYVYIPLGGNRVSYIKWIRNIFVVWFLTGLWHGAAWNFAIWGLYFGILLYLERTFLADLLHRAPRVLRHAYVLLAVMVSWTIFELNTADQIFRYLGDMFALSDIPLGNQEAAYLLRSNLVLLAVAVVGSMPLLKNLGERLSERRVVRVAAAPVFHTLLLFVSYAYLIDSTFNPFLYFRF